MPRGQMGLGFLISLVVEDGGFEGDKDGVGCEG